MGKAASSKRRHAGSAGSGSGILDVIRRDLMAFFTSKSIRETIESVVIAFALAFLFRTFEAEAFVIPTGSMAPTLQGRHQYVDCPMCEHSYRISASQEVDQATEVQVADVASGQCPNCGYSTCTNLALGRRKEVEARYDDEPLPFNSGAVELGGDSSSRNGDRILVSKFAYEIGEPKRWDVFVFRYPGQTSRNYIKRLVGLPGENLKIERGDIYTGPYQPLGEEDTGAQAMRIERKPPNKVLAMMQLVYDNDHQAQKLAEAGWPPRWTSWPRGAEATPGGWVAEDDRRVFSTDGTAPQDMFIRYQHFFPSWNDWEAILRTDRFYQPPKPQLIADAYAYNTSAAYPFPRDEDGKIIVDSEGEKAWYRGAPSYADTMAQGLHWVGDLIFACELEVKGAAGDAILELVEGGRKFQCRIDVATGEAKLTIDGSDEAFSDDEEGATKPLVQTGVKGTGTYELTMANVDNQLLLWVDGDLIARAPFEVLGNVVPQREDLAPAAIGSRGAALEARHLRVYRDVYYVATDARGYKSDYLSGPLGRDRLNNLGYSNWDAEEDRIEFLSTPSQWDNFQNMASVDFALAEFPDQPEKDRFLALGDNSPQSKDSRLWAPRSREFFVERQLLIGRALSIYWPLNHLRLVR